MVYTVLKFLVNFLVLVYTFSWNTATNPDLYRGYAFRRAYDGDTIRVVGLDSSIRLVGLDTPEISRHGGRYRGEFALDAKYFTTEFLRGENVHLDLLGKDRYGRYLGHVVNSRGWLNYKLLEEGLARVYFFKDTMDYRTYFLAQAYRKAYYNKRGVFSLYDSAPVLRKGMNWRKYLGKIVWLEMRVDRYEKRYRYNNLYSDWAVITIRDEEFDVMFGKFLDFKSLIGKKLRAFGELYEFRGMPNIVVRMPFELVVLEEKQ